MPWPRLPVESAIACNTECNRSYTLAQTLRLSLNRSSIWWIPVVWSQRFVGNLALPCIPANKCTQGFVDDWDEVGRLVQARRWELSGTPTTDDLPPPASVQLSVDLRYNYDAADNRIVKTAIADLEQVHTVYIFGSLELRRAHFLSGGTPDYERTATTEVPYLTAQGVRLARAVFDREQTTLPAIDGRKLHVFFELGDQLGSTSLALDSATSELVEASTYQAYGGSDSDYRPGRWDSFREDYRFTGKEDDVEAGLFRENRPKVLRDNPVCEYCGKRPSTQADHIEPLVANSSAEHPAARG
jgi:hypothetical protein